MSVASICRRGVICVRPEMPVREAAQLMRRDHVGALIVVDGDPSQLAGRRPVGILTDRDVVMTIVAADVDADAVRIGEAMSDNLLTASEYDDPLLVVGKMRARQVRRVPVLNAAGLVVGLLSFDDLLDALAQSLTDLARLALGERERERQQRR